MAKNQANAKQYPKAELWLFENYAHSSSMLSFKKIGHTLENKQKNKCVFIHVFMQLIIMKVKMKNKNKNRSHRYDINRTRSRNEHRYSKYKTCLNMIMLTSIKQRLSNI